MLTRSTEKWSLSGKLSVVVKRSRFVLAALLVLTTAAIAVHDAQSHEGHPTLAKFSDIRMERAFPTNCGEENPGQLSYTLLEPARVRIRVVAFGTRELFLRQVVDWEVRDAGPHTETWDCRDNSGHLISKEDVVVRLIGEPMSTYLPGTMPLKDLSAEENIHGHKFGHIHNKHHEWACHESRLRVVSPVEEETIGGKVLIRSAVDEKRRGYGDTYGYGVRYYIDYVLVNEEFYKPESGGVFAYELDTTAFPDGEHMLHLGMCDHNDHATSASVTIVIDNSKLVTGR